MRIPSSLVPLAVAASLLSATVSDAQSRPAAATIAAFEVTPYAGYLMAGALIDGPLGTSVGAAPAPLIGAQLGVRLSSNVSLVGNVATGSSDIKAGIPVIGGYSIAQSRVVLYDAGLQLDLPLATMSGTAFAPFLQGGIGGMRQEIGHSMLTVKSHSLAANVGVGADITVGSGVGLRIMARDYVTRFDAQEATMIDIDTRTTQTYALSVGVRFSF